MHGNTIIPIEHWLSTLKHVAIYCVVRCCSHLLLSLRWIQGQGHSMAWLVTAKVKFAHLLYIMLLSLREPAELHCTVAKFGRTVCLWSCPRYSRTGRAWDHCIFVCIDRHRPSCFVAHGNFNFSNESFLVSSCHFLTWGSLGLSLCLEI